ncbi:MAG: hypothetical protein ACI9MU_003627, partial [Alphaproteobacteria bacterium]
SWLCVGFHAVRATGTACYRMLHPPGARIMTTKPLKGHKLYHKSLKSQEKSQIHVAKRRPQKASIIRGLPHTKSASPDHANQARLD